MTTEAAFAAENKGSKSLGGLQCVGYFRKSVLREDWERTSEENDQKREINAEVHRLEGSISFYLSDAPRLVPAIERAGLMTAVTMLQADLADVLIVPSIEAIALSPTDLVQVLQLVIVLGKRLVILEEGIDTGTDAGRLFALVALGSESTERTGLQRQARKGAI